MRVLESVRQAGYRDTAARMGGAEPLYRLNQLGVSHFPRDNSKQALRYPFPPNNLGLEANDQSYCSGSSRDHWSRFLSTSTFDRAWKRVARRRGAPGSDFVSVEAFSVDASQALIKLINEIRVGDYRPQRPLWLEVKKRDGRSRRLAILAVRDRVVQQAVLQVLGPLWDTHFSPCSYAYRRGRSAVQAVAAVERGLAGGRTQIVDGDIQAFFDTVNHRQLFDAVEAWTPDKPLADFIRTLVVSTSPTPHTGIAQGAATSPLLANLYLHRFDHALLAAGYVLVRYADDFVILCDSRSEALSALRYARQVLEGLQLALNPAKSHIVSFEEGFVFLGFHFSRAGVQPSTEAVESLHMKIARCESADKCERVRRGWRSYFVRHTDNPCACLRTRKHQAVAATDWIGRTGDGNMAGPIGWDVPVMRSHAEATEASRRILRGGVERRLVRRTLDYPDLPCDEWPHSPQCGLSISARHEPANRHDIMPRYWNQHPRPAERRILRLDRNHRPVSRFSLSTQRDGLRGIRRGCLRGAAPPLDLARTNVCRCVARARVRHVYAGACLARTAAAAGVFLEHDDEGAT